MKRGRQETLDNDNVSTRSMTTTTTTTQFSSSRMSQYHHDILARAMNFSELSCDQDEPLSDCSVPNSNSNTQSVRNILHSTNNSSHTTQGQLLFKEISIRDALSAETAPTMATTNDDASEPIAVGKQASVGTVEHEIPNDPTLDFSNSLVARTLQTDTFESLSPQSPLLLHCASTISSLPDDAVIPVYCTPPPLAAQRRDEDSLTAAAATQDSIQQAAFAERTANEMAHVVQWWYNTTTTTKNATTGTSKNGTASMDVLSAAPWNTPLRAKTTTSSLDNETIDSLGQSQSLPFNSLLWDDDDIPNGDAQSVLYSRDSNSMASMPNDQRLCASSSCAALPSAKALASFDKCIAELWHVTSESASARYRVDSATAARSNDTVVTTASGASKSHCSNRTGTSTRMEVQLDKLDEDLSIQARREPMSKRCSFHSASLEEMLTVSSTSSASNVQSEQPPRPTSHAVDLSSLGEHADTNKRLLWQENYALRRRLQSLEGIIAVLCLIVLLLAWQLATVPRPASLPISQSTPSDCSKVDTIIDYTRLSHELRKVLAESPSTAQCDRPLAE
jgi:hypothetical protein